MHVRFSRRARSDLRSIADYIAERNPRAAERAIDKILLAILHLETFPLLGRPGRLEGTRELVTRALPVIVVYEIADDYHINVERVLHAKRQWPPEIDE